MDPATAMIIASLVSAGTEAAGSALSSKKNKKARKLLNRESKRDVYGHLYSDAIQRNADLEESHLANRARSSRRGAKNMMNTSDLLREAFNI